MKKILLLPVYLLLATGAVSLHAQGTTAFTYQGRLNLSGAPANGAFDFKFQLAHGPSDPADSRTAQTNANVAVSNGLFVAQIDLGSLSGQPYWLDIGVRPAGSANPFTMLSPRPQLTPAPYANFAARAGSYEGSIADFQLSPNVANWGPNRTFTATVNFAPGGRPPLPPFTVDSSVLIANLNAEKLGGYRAADFWKLNGNADTVPGAHYVGTSDNQPLELRANFQGASAWSRVPAPRTWSRQATSRSVRERGRCSISGAPITGSACKTPRFISGRDPAICSSVPEGTSLGMPADSTATRLLIPARHPFCSILPKS